MPVLKNSLVLVLLATLAVTLRADDWPQWRGPQRDGQWREEGVVGQFATERLEPVWRQPIGSGYSGPTVADGRVFVTDRLVNPKEVERIHCFDEKTGERQWSVTYDCPYLGISYTAGPRASVTIDDGRAYALGAAGNLHCLDVQSGDILWKRDLDTEYRIRETDRMPIWGIAAAPLIYQDLVILHIGGADGACILALDKKTGDEQWRALDDRAQYSAPILIEQAGKPVVVCWTGDAIAGLDPDSGNVHWRVPFKPRNMPIGVATPVVAGDRLFVTSFYDGSLMLKLHQDSPDATKLWHRVGRSEENTEALQSILSTPLLIGDYIYGVDSYGELRCLRASDGERVWEDLTATPRARWSNLHFVQNGDRVWMFNERGELIIARLSPSGYEEISRAQLIEPTTDQLRQRGGVCWAHPAFANRHVFVRNDREILCASLEE